MLQLGAAAECAGNYLRGQPIGWLSSGWPISCIAGSIASAPLAIPPIPITAARLLRDAVIVRQVEYLTVLPAAFAFW